MLQQLKFNHIGVACKNIEKEYKYFQNLGYSSISDIFEDSNQGIRGLFIAAEGQPTLELLENLNENGPLTNILKKGTKFYHYAYETNNIEQDFKKLIEEYGGVVISPIKNAVYYNKVAFCMLRNMLIIELVQK